MAFVPQQQRQYNHGNDGIHRIDGIVHGVPLATISTSGSHIGTTYWRYPTSKRTSSIQLSANDNDTEEVPINTSLIRQLVFNQGLIGYSIWTKGLGYEVLTRDADFHFLSTSFLPLAILGVLPLLALSQTIETSESPLVSTLNLSTDMQMLRIFGPKPRPIVAAIVSLFLAGLTGLVEEVTFRGEILPTLTQWSTLPGNLPFPVEQTQGIYYGVALSTFIFAALHVNPEGFFKGRAAATDAGILLALQLCTGATFAGLYLATGNLAVPIVSHALYDFYTFYKTHLVVTTQMEYAVRNLEMDASPSAIEEKWIDMRGDTFVREARQTFYLMDTNRDGTVSREELRVALYSYGISLSKGESEVVLEKADADGSGEIDFEEFLGFMGTEGSTAKAIKGSLLGVR